MRSTILFLCSLFIPVILIAQTDPCETHPLFNLMPEHKVSYCDKKDFNEIEIQQREKNGSVSTLKKSGIYLSSTYQFTGAWEKRPSMAQIIQNYSNATENAGGKVLNKTSSEVSLSLKKGGDQYWVNVSGDGSGIYTVATVQEASMKQDIVVTAEQIKKDITEEGKAIFYGIYFETGKATLEAKSDAAIAQMAKYLQANASVKVHIVGHTDNTGSYDNNMKLSMERAQAVVNVLKQTHGISNDRIQASGVGSLAPVTTNATENGKAKNRRVEMVLR